MDLFIYIFMGCYITFLIGILIWNTIEITYTDKREAKRTKDQLTAIEHYNIIESTKNKKDIKQLKRQIEILNNKIEFLFEVNEPQINAKVKEECEVAKKKVKEELEELSNLLQNAIDELFGQEIKETNKEKKNVK